MNFEEDEVNGMMENLSPHRCKACNGLIDYHDKDMCRIHWKLEKDKQQKRWGICGAVLLGCLVTVVAIIINAILTSS